MKVKNFEVGMTLNLGGNESKKLSMFLELDKHESVTEAYLNSQELLAKLISNGNPVLYEECLKKLSCNFTTDEYERMVEEWQEKSEKLQELNKDLLSIERRLSIFMATKERVDKLTCLLHHADCLQEFNEMLNAFSIINLSEKINDFSWPNEFIELKPDHRSQDLIE